MDLGEEGGSSSFPVFGRLSEIGTDQYWPVSSF